MKSASEDINEKLFSLLQGNRVIARIDQTTVYRSLSDDPANIYSILLVAGYLKTLNKELQADGSYLCEVAIPNREIAAVYKSEILTYLQNVGAINKTTSNMFAESLYSNDVDKLQKSISEYVLKSVSFYDAGTEGFYHGLVLGLIAMMDNQYMVKSNRESGYGRYDVSLIPRNNKKTGIIMELKYEKDLDEKELNKLADEALRQIEDKEYITEMKDEGVSDVLKLGMAFSGKKVVIKAL